MTPPNPEPKPARRTMPLRHKLMLALACEILLVGFRQVDLTPRQTGILIEAPAMPHHVIT
jgi:hypothetical protein